MAGPDRPPAHTLCFKYGESVTHTYGLSVSLDTWLIFAAPKYKDWIKNSAAERVSVDGCTELTGAFGSGEPVKAP
jgi:hypothetical protein